MSHPRDLLPAYAAGTLPPGSHRAVSAHVTGCRACMDELQAWRMVAQATRARSAAVAAPPPFAAILARLRSASPVVAPYRGRVGERPLVRAARLLWRQPRLIGDEPADPNERRLRGALLVEGRQPFRQA